MTLRLALRIGDPRTHKTVISSRRGGSDSGVLEFKQCAPMATAQRRTNRGSNRVNGPFGHFVLRAGAVHSIKSSHSRGGGSNLHWFIGKRRHDLVREATQALTRAAEAHDHVFDAGSTQGFEFAHDLVWRADQAVRLRFLGRMTSRVERLAARPEHRPGLPHQRPRVGLADASESRGAV